MLPVHCAVTSEVTRLTTPNRRPAPLLQINGALNDASVLQRHWQPDLEQCNANNSSFGASMSHIQAANSAPMAPCNPATVFALSWM